MSSRRRLVSRAVLVAAATLTILVAPARAADDVQVGEGAAAVNAAGGQNTSEEGTNELVFSAAVSAAGDGGGSGAANQTSTITDSPSGIAVRARSSVSSEGTEEPAVGLSTMRRNFTVTGTTLSYRVNGSFTSSVSTGHVSFNVSFRRNGAAETVFDFGGNFSKSGTLPPGDYELFMETRCRNGCSGESDLSLDLGDPAPPVAIGSGPSGLVNSRSARFEFTTTEPNPPAGQYQCRIDGQPDFSACSSPVSLSDLSDGEHRFRVRYDPDGSEPPSAPTEQVWTVDATAPAVSFDSAPSGENNPSSAQIAFRSSEPDGASFRCQLDDGAAFDCSSPHSLFDLSDGAHSFSVASTDRTGNVSLPATVSWTVGPPEPISVACPAGGESAGFGAIRLVARAEDACFFEDTVGGQAAKVSLGQVTLNGVRLTPAPGTRIIVSERLDDGTVKTDGPVTVGFGNLTGPQTISGTLGVLDLTGLTTAAGLGNKVLAFAEGSVLAPGSPAKFALGVALDLSSEGGGQAKVTFRVTLPKAAFRSLPGRGPAVEGVTLEFSPTFSNDRGVSLGGRIKLASVYLFGNKVKDLDLAYDHGTGVFDGSVGIAFGEARPARAEPTLTAAISLAPTTSPCGLAKFGLQASNLNKHIGRGVYLQRYGGSFECTGAAPNAIVKLAANVGVSAGPRIAIGSFEAEALSIDGTGTLAIPLGPQPPELFSFEVKGVGKIVDVPVSEQTIKYTPPATVRASGKLDFTIGGYGAQLTYGEQGSFISEDAFNIEAAGRANLFFVEAVAQAVYSSTGFAVCVGAQNRRTGFGKRWFGGEGVTALAACDVGPFRATIAAARGAGAGGEGFTVERERPLTVLAADGEGAPPKLVVSGPGGERIETPAGPEGVSTKDTLLIQDTDASTTYVVLFKPAAGPWSVSTAAGSPAITGLRTARGLPPVRIAAKVTGKGARRTLSWKGTGLGGQRTQFLERGRGSANTLANTTKASGRLRFRPDPQLGTKRTIGAIVSNRGLPRLTRTVASFRVAPPPRARRIKRLGLRKGTLSWREQRGVKAYELAIVRPNGTTTSHRTRAARLRLRGLPRRGRIRVSILAIDQLDRPGPVAKVGFKLGRG